MLISSTPELFYTERAHLRMLKVLDGVFHQRLNKDGVLPPEDVKNIFTNLEEIIQLHGNPTHQHTFLMFKEMLNVCVCSACSFYHRADDCDQEEERDVRDRADRRRPPGLGKTRQASTRRRFKCWHICTT